MAQIKRSIREQKRKERAKEEGRDLPHSSKRHRGNGSNNHRTPYRSSRQGERYHDRRDRYHWSRNDYPSNNRRGDGRDGHHHNNNHSSRGDGHYNNNRRGGHDNNQKNNNPDRGGHDNDGRGGQRNNHARGHGNNNGGHVHHLSERGRSASRSPERSRS